jgi:hypothetical protein
MYYHYISPLHPHGIRTFPVEGTAWCGRSFSGGKLRSVSGGSMSFWRPGRATWSAYLGTIKMLGLRWFPVVYITWFNTV